MTSPAGLRQALACSRVTMLPTKAYRNPLFFDLLTVVGVLNLTLLHMSVYTVSSKQGTTKTFLFVTRVTVVFQGSIISSH